MRFDLRTMIAMLSRFSTARSDWLLLEFEIEVDKQYQNQRCTVISKSDRGNKRSE